MDVKPRILIIFNPNAGQRRKKLYNSVMSELDQHGISYDIFSTKHAGHGTELATDNLNNENYDIIAAAGGDGTINEVLNGLYGSDKTMGIIPLGTANVLARELGIKVNAKSIVKALISNNHTNIFPASINGQYFTLMASVGYDALSVKNVNLGLKKKIGEIAYFIAFLKEIFFGKPIKYNIEINGDRHYCSAAIITNAKYYAGNYICAPEASLEEQKLHAILFKKSGAWAAICYLFALITSNIKGRKDVEYIDTKCVTITADVDAPAQIDGDYFGELPVIVKSAEKPVRISSP